MNREQLLTLWNDQLTEGNWVPSWTDSLKGLTVEQALWTPNSGPLTHCLWQEVVHVTYWRSVTRLHLAGEPRPSEEETERLQFALPEVTDAAAWDATLAAFWQAHDALAEAIADESKDLTRIPYHLLHDAYHLGRVTQLRAMQGTPPQF